MKVYKKDGSEIELITSDNGIHSPNEINTGKVWHSGGKVHPIYRKVLYSLTLVAGSNLIYHNIENLDFITYITGLTTLKNGRMQIIPESCCDNIAQYGISIRDITTSSLKVLMGTGYTGDNEPAVGKSHIVVEYIKKVS